MIRSDIFRGMLGVAFVLYGLASVLAWWLPPQWISSSSVAYSLQLAAQGVAATPLTTGQRVVGMLATLPSLLALGWALRCLSRLLRSFQRGEGFTPAAGKAYQRFCGSLCLGLVLVLLEGIWRSLGNFMLQSAGGKLTLQLEISGGDVLAIGVAALFYLLHHLMQHGQKLQQENSEFI